MGSKAIIERNDTDREVMKFLPVRDISKKTSMIILLCILGLSAILMFAKLGERPLHHDEGIHAVFAHKIYKDFNNYGGYDPTYHGPFLYYSNALVYHIFGATDFTARLLPALFGLGLVALVYTFSDRLGRGPSIIIAGMIAISPIMVYFSRFIRNDIYIAVFSVLAVLGVLKYAKTRRGIYMYVASASLALAFCTKENTYIHVFIFVSFVALWLAAGMIKAAGWWTSISEGIRKKWWMVVLAFVFLIASFLGTGKLIESEGCRATIGFALRNELVTIFLALVSIAAVVCAIRFRRSVFVLLVPVCVSLSMGLWLVKGKGDNSGLSVEGYTASTLTPEVMTRILIDKWPHFSVAEGRVRQPLTILKGFAIGGGAYGLVLETFPVVVFTLAATIWFVVFYFWSAERREAIREWLTQARVFLKDEWPVLLCSGFIFGIIWVVLFTSFFRIPGDWNGFRKSFDYWWYQHKVQRVKGPKWYHLPRLAVYEFLLITATIAAFRRLWRRRNVLFFFFVYWTLAAVAAYSYAGEKVPWLTVHIVTPLAFVGGISIWELLTTARWKATKWSWRFVLLLLGAFTLFNAVRASFVYPVPYWDEYAAEKKGLPKRTPNRVEMTNYVQTTADIKTMMEIIDDAAEKSGLGTQIPMISFGDANWPETWYYQTRGYERIYWAQFDGKTLPDVRDVEAVVIAGNLRFKGDIAKAVGDKYEAYRFRQRGWWPGPGDMIPLFGPGSDRWSSYSKWTRLKRLPEFLWVAAPKVLRYFFTRDIYSGVGSTDICMFVLKDIRPGMQIPRVDFGEPARPHGGEPTRMEAVNVWGAKGDRQGRFLEPRGIAIASDGTVYVADSKNHRVQKFDSDGRFLLQWGRRSPEQKGKMPPPGTFNDPNGVAVDPKGNVYVTDTWNHRIQKFTADGKFLKSWQAGEGHFYGPRGIAVAKDGSVFVTDTGNKRVMKYTAEGRLIKTWGRAGDGPGEFAEPVGITVDRTGRVFVADTDNHRVQVFDSDGKFERELKVFGWEQFYSEPHIAITRDGNVVVTDSFNNRVTVYDMIGRKVLDWGGEGAGSGFFNRPVGIAVGANGDVFVSDTANHRLQVFRLAAEARDPMMPGKVEPEQ